MTTVLITGANRGIGLALATLYAARGDRVIATCRDPGAAEALAGVPGDIAVEPMDVADHDSIDALAGRLSGMAVDLLINNAGVLGGPRQSFGDMDYDAWAEAIRINTMGPMKVAEAFVANLVAGDRRVLACVSSEMGSIARTTGGYYAYRSSKAALNMVGRNLARELSARGIIVLLAHPGWVNTAMGGRTAPVTPGTSAGALAALFDRATRADSGGFFNHDGGVLPW